MLTDCTTGPDYGGNNRARTCDPLLVRQMLSQLSYAPVVLKVFYLSDVIDYTSCRPVCQELFSSFLNFFRVPVFAELCTLNSTDYSRLFRFVKRFLLIPEYLPE